MKRLRTYLQCGLGNQCFIYATARALALRACVDVTLDLDYLSEDFVYRRKLAQDSFACAFELAKPHVKWVRVGKLLRDRTLRVGNLCIDRRPFKFRLLPTDVVMLYYATWKALPQIPIRSSVSAKTVSSTSTRRQS